MMRLFSVVAAAVFALALLASCRQAGSNTASEPAEAAHWARRGPLWVPPVKTLTQGDETYYLGVKPARLARFVAKNGLRPLREWPQMLATGHRGYLPPPAIRALHRRDPLMSGSRVTTVSSAKGYTAIYYNPDHAYLVIQP